MKLKVPYYSQFRDNIREEWKPKACTVTCLKMAGDFIAPERLPSIDQLFSEALFHSGSMKSRGLIVGSNLSHGFPHDVIVLLAHNYGFLAYREEFKSKFVGKDGSIKESQYSVEMTEKGINRLCQAIRDGKPVIVSVLPGLSEGGSFHTILLVGFEEENGEISGFYYHDPDSRVLDLDTIYIPLSKFLEFWRKMAIFIG